MPASADDHAGLFQQHRGLLFALAYRLLGSAAEAEDVLQDAYLRFQAVALREVDNPRAYLAAIVTRLCLNLLTSATARRQVYVGPWLPEPILTTEAADLAVPGARLDQEESISLAFLTLLEQLSPAERAVFILREVFDYEYAEIAEVLARTEPACRKLFSRAKAYLAQGRPRFKTTPEEHRRLLLQFMDAAGQGDLDGLTHLLAEEVTFWADGGGKVRGAALRPVRGRAAVARFVLSVTARFLPVGATLAVAQINGRPTLLIRHAAGQPAMVISLEFEAGQVVGIWVVANPDKLTALG